MSRLSRGEEFEQLRPLLFSIAYRILGSVTAAEDAVQETWLRYESSPTQPTSIKAFLSAVVTRISIDVARSATLRRETYVGPWLPDPLLTDPYEDPARSAELADSLSMIDDVGAFASIMRQALRGDPLRLQTTNQRNALNRQQLPQRPQQLSTTTPAAHPRWTRGPHLKCEDPASNYPQVLTIAFASVERAHPVQESRVITGPISTSRDCQRNAVRPPG